MCAIRLHRPGPGLAPGRWLGVRAVLRPPPPPSAPGAYDFQRRAWFAGLGAVGYALGTPRAAPVPPGAETGGLRRWLAGLRQDIAERVRAALEGETGAVAAALLTGKRGAIPSMVLEAMRGSGLAHLLAISGLHIGLVAGIVFFGARAALALVPALALRMPIKKWAAAAALLAAFYYLFLAGATVPTQRAFLMIGRMLLAVLTDRTAITMRPVALAAVVVLALAPEALLSASFQMSFAAVIGLVAGYEALAPRFRAWRRAGDGLRAGGWRAARLYLSGVAITTMIATVATAPFAIYHFNRLAAYGLAANLFAVPITGLWIMPWGLLACLVLPLGAEGVALVPMGWGIDAVVTIARTVSGWPGAVRVVPALPTVGLVLIAFGGLWLCLWRRPWRLLGVVALAAGFAAIALARPPDVLVTGDAKLVGVRAQDGGYMLSSRRAARFSAERWLARAGERDALAWPASGASPDGRLRCDTLGCIYRKDGRRLALILDSRAIPEDCHTAEVVLATVPIRPACPVPNHVLDRFDLWREGAHAIWIDAGGVRIETVAGWRGTRPWVPRRGIGERD